MDQQQDLPALAAAGPGGDGGQGVPGPVAPQGQENGALQGRIRHPKTPCPMCGASVSRLKLHLRRWHAGLPSSICPVDGCGKQFHSARPDQLRDHLSRSHDMYGPNDRNARSTRYAHLDRKKIHLLKHRLAADTTALNKAKADLAAAEYLLRSTFEPNYTPAHGFATPSSATNVVNGEEDAPSKDTVVRKLIAVRQELYQIWEPALAEVNQRYQAYVDRGANLAFKHLDDD